MSTTRVDSILPSNCHLRLSASAILELVAPGASRLCAFESARIFALETCILFAHTSNLVATAHFFFGHCSTRLLVACPTRHEWTLSPRPQRTLARLHLFHGLLPTTRSASRPVTCRLTDYSLHGVLPTNNAPFCDALPPIDYTLRQRANPLDA